MPIESKRRIGAVGRSGTFYVTLPLGWCHGSGIEVGAEVRVLANRFLVLLPPDEHAQGERILRLMREGAL